MGWSVIASAESSLSQCDDSFVSVCSWNDWCGTIRCDSSQQSEWRTHTLPARHEVLSPR